MNSLHRVLLGTYLLVMCGFLFMRQEILPLGWSPVYGLLFVSGIFFRIVPAYLLFAVPFLVQDLVLGFNYNYFNFSGLAITMAGYLFILLASKASGLKDGGLVILRNSVLVGVGFYLITSTLSFLLDPYYTKTISSWLMCLTVGHPDIYPSAFYFFRTTIYSTVLFTVFSLVMVKVLIVTISTVFKFSDSEKYDHISNNPDN